MRLAALSLVVLFAPSVASAACLRADSSVVGEFRRSDYVAKVRVERETWLDMDFQPTNLNPKISRSAAKAIDYAGTNYRVSLLNSFKGKLPRRFDIYSENTSARAPLEVGRDYLVFISREPRSDAYVRAGALTIDNCGNSGLWAQKRGVAPIVEKLATTGR